MKGNRQLMDKSEILLAVSFYCASYLYTISVLVRFQTNLTPDNTPPRPAPKEVAGNQRI